MAKRILIVYYSWVGNARKVAEQIHGAVGGELFELLPVTPYSADYRVCLEQARKEIPAGFKPELKTKPASIADFDIIFAGSPNWCSSIAPPLATFLSSFDFNGKTIAPFCTYGGGGAGQAYDFRGGYNGDGGTGGDGLIQVVYYYYE